MCLILKNFVCIFLRFFVIFYFLVSIFELFLPPIVEVCVCLFRERVLFIGTQFSILYTSMYSAVPIIKLFAWGEGDSGGHVLRETTSRDLCEIEIMLFIGT
jgi:hypothetical protein